MRRHTAFLVRLALLVGLLIAEAVLITTERTDPHVACDAAQIQAQLHLVPDDDELRLLYRCHHSD